MGQLQRWRHGFGTPRALCKEHPDGWIQRRHQLGGTRALYTRGALASHLNPKWQGRECSVVLGTRVSLAQSLELGCTLTRTVHGPVAALVRQLGLLWAKGSGIPEVKWQAAYGACPVHWSMLSRQRNVDCQPLLPGESFSSSLFGRVLGLAPLYASCSFKLWYFVYVRLCAPGHLGQRQPRGPGTC